MTIPDHAAEAALDAFYSLDAPWHEGLIADMSRALSAAYPVLTARIAELERALGAARGAHDAPDAAPTHTDIMLSPEAIDRALDEPGTAHRDLSEMCGGTFHTLDAWLETRPDLKNAGTPKQLDEYNAWIRSMASTESRLAALEQRPAWTAEKEALLQSCVEFLAGHLFWEGTAARRNSDKLLDARNTAFPENDACETCEGAGWLDQRVGGFPITAWCECSDCQNPKRLRCPSES